MYITTAISYANGPPHIGHAFEFVIADAIARFYRMNGKNVFFLTGMDEHGQKIQKTAEEQKMTPIMLCNSVSELFKKLDVDLNISYDRFIRTTEDDHKQMVYNLFDKCMKNDDIYLGEYVGWYNPREENFVSEFEASQTNYKDPITNKDFIKMKEPSYFFRLSKYGKRIKQFLIDNPDFIVGCHGKTEIINRLDENELHDISISR
jgi:methionyl-tRNA synthetase